MNSIVLGTASYRRLKDEVRRVSRLSVQLSRKVQRQPTNFVPFFLRQPQEAKLTAQSLCRVQSISFPVVLLVFPHFSTLYFPTPSRLQF